MREQDFRKYFLLGLVLFLLVFSFYVIRSYLTALFSAAVLAYMFHPLYRWVRNVSRSPFFSSIFMCALITLLVLIPFAFFTHLLIKESVFLYSSGTLSTISERISSAVGETLGLSDFVETGVARAISSVTDAASAFFMSVPAMVMQFLIMLYTLFFFFVQGEKIFARIEKDLPIEDKKTIFKHLSEMVYGVSYGFFAVAILELVSSALVFWFLGIRAPLIWALAIGFLALLPVIGPTFVWVPLALVYYFRGSLFQVVGIVVFGLILSIIVDTIVRQKIIGDRTRLHPVVALLGILGGLQIFGFIGVVVGPIVLSSAVVLAKMYYEKYVIK